MPPRLIRVQRPGPTPITGPRTVNRWNSRAPRLGFRPWCSKDEYSQLVVSCTTADFGPDVGISCTTRYSIWGARHDLMMEAFGGKGFCVEDPKHLRGALDEAMNFRRP